ncbi:hypothetical protein SAMN05444745_1349 [Arthrobacter sp. OV608]|nr:hypothetical protein SAMN05444745_1349 [Arthrobacter sp. OV608]
MKTGIKFYNTDETFPPLDFTCMVEDSGIGSICLPDHSHIPVASRVLDRTRAVTASLTTPVALSEGSWDGSTATLAGGAGVRANSSGSRV